MVGVAVTESICGEVLSGATIGLFEQGREILRLVLILEPVDEVVRWKLAGGSRMIAEEIADGVVVLTVGEAAQHRRGSLGSLRGRPVIVPGLDQFFAGEIRQNFDPGNQDCLFLGSHLDTFTAAVGPTLRRLPKKEGILRMLAVDQDYQRFSKRFQPVLRRIFLGEVQTGCRGNAVAVVAAGTPGFFEHRIDGTGKRRILGRRERPKCCDKQDEDRSHSEQCASQARIACRRGQAQAKTLQFYLKRNKTKATRQVGTRIRAIGHVVCSGTAFMELMV